MHFEKSRLNKRDKSKDIFWDDGIEGIVVMIIDGAED